MATLFSDILEVSISASGWTAVTVPNTVSAKSFLAKCRDSAAFLVKIDNDATRYITVPSSLSGDIDPAADNALFYVKGTTTTTLEVLLKRE